MLLHFQLVRSLLHVSHGVNMNLDQQVTSLELSKRLNESGLKQDSLFYWHTYNNKDWQLNHDAQGCACNEFISAYTVAELSQILPPIIQATTASGSDYPLTIYKPNDWHLAYGSGHKIKFAYAHENLAIIMAAAIIWAIENNLVTDEWRAQWMTFVAKVLEVIKIPYACSDEEREKIVKEVASDYGINLENENNG